MSRDRDQDRLDKRNMRHKSIRFGKECDMGNGEKEIKDDIQVSP